MVFLPGTQGRPGQYTYILRAGASRGFHSIGLNYPNQIAMGALCQVSSDPECYWSARNVIIFGTGTPVAGQSPISKADSIVNRLEKLLSWMQTSYPVEGWGQFVLANGSVDWSKVILAGHSQGGGHVGVLAKSVALSRAVYFSSPEDWYENTDTPASWPRTRANVTPADQQYGFGSDDDTLVPNAHAFIHWNNLGLPKPATGPVSIDGTSTPFTNSRQLRTKQTFNPASTAITLALKYHGVTVVDTSTPLDTGGKPLFDTNGVWAYLCFE
ncbi:MAG: BPSS1187 family protein [Gammaproteobacteria bacterium]